ncbi:MAG TPA: Twin-arginine translocation pathway signal sequence domain-containing protein [Gammaproteobacteria bacterium]|nr:Twin-arginine translocation pathway signal sequence domain-containing protein [Gammaproteobacteria bacterium]
MHRREFLQYLGLAPLAAWSGGLALAAAPGTDYRRLLVLVELKGGNDGLNTVIPYADREYYRLRPKLGMARDQILQLDEQTGLHPSLSSWMPLWQSKELAVVQGVGYPQPNLSHFRSIEIWDTASDSDRYLDKGWLTQVFEQYPPPRTFAADGVVVGGSDLGPMAGGSTRAIALTSPERFLSQAARLENNAGNSRNPALAHLLKVEADIRQAAAGLRSAHAFRAEFPRSAFGNSLKAAAQVVAASRQVAVIKVSLNGFDTHSNQRNVQARLLKELSEGLVAFRSALMELERWSSTLMMTYAEFGRRPQENGSGGTDHGTANAHFLLGGAVQGGLYGERPALTGLDGGNLRHSVDFRQLYATATEKWWSLPAGSLFGGHYQPLTVLKI